MVRVVPPLLDASKVRYLAFEGGGGKGAVYLGALLALGPENAGVLRWSTHPRTGRRVLDPRVIKGVAGASAGAITSALIASGYILQEIERFALAAPTTTDFYDRAFPPHRPHVPAPGERRTAKGMSPAPQPSGSVKFARFLSETYGVPLRAARSLVGQPFSTILDPEQFVGYAIGLVDSFGLMSGCAARQLIDDMIASKTRDTDDRPIRNATFQQHWDYHHVKLAVTATNLETGTPFTFSVDTAADFSVADAVRISMGFPFIYMPIIIEKGPYKGVWIDGGVLNNTPLHVFDVEGRLNPAMLGIRLEKTKPEKIDNLWKFTKAVMGAFFAVGENLQVMTETDRNATIVLDTEGIGTLDFEPDPALLRQLIEKAAVNVVRRFKGPNGRVEPAKSYPADPP